MLSFMYDGELTLKKMILGLIGLIVVYAVIKRLNEERKIAALGGHTTRAAGWTPFGQFSCHS